MNAPQIATPNPVPFTTEGPQPLLRETPSAAPYPVHALGPLQEAVEAVQGSTQAPVAIAAQSALSVASLAVQGFADVETLGGDKPLSLYCMTIARSGERKTACDEILSAGLNEYERALAEQHKEDMKAWKSRHALWKVEHDSILNAMKAKGGKGKTRIEAEADIAALGDEPAAPPMPDRVVTEPTFEGLTRKFAEGMPTLGIFSDEGGQFLGGSAMSSDNRQKTLGALNKLWQGHPIRRTRQGEGSSVMYGRRLAMHLMVQPGVARDFMADPKADDTGFLPRFLLCEPATTIGTRMTCNARRNEAATDRFARRLRGILEAPLPMDPESRALEPRRLPLADDARELLIAFADAIELQQAEGGELSGVTGYASKAAEQACRISGVLAMWRDLKAPAVTRSDMASGIDLAQYYLAEALRLSDAANVSEESARAERLRRWLVETWPDDTITTRDVVQKAPTRSLRETKAAAATLAMLEQHGWVVALPAGTVIRGVARSTGWAIVKGGGNVV